MNDKVMTIRGNAHGRKDRHEPAKWRVCDYTNLRTPVGECSWDWTVHVT